MPFEFIDGFDAYNADPSSEVVARAESYIDETYVFTGARLYFSPREVDVLTNRLDEPWMVHESTGLPFDVCENLCDSLNSSLKAARFAHVGLTMLDEERTILADCINSTTYADHWRDDPRAHRQAIRVIRRVALKLRGIGISAKDVDSLTGAVL